MIRTVAISLLCAFLVSCTPPSTSAPLPSATPTLFLPSPTSTSPPSLTPPPFSLILTSTPVPCDPTTTEFCVTDGHFFFQRPIHPPENTSVDITYRYGSTANGKRDPHTGVEFLNKFGTPVYAAGAGTVIFAGPDKSPLYSPWPDYYGNLVVIEHPDDLYTLYAHLSKILVEQGQSVAAGDQIGEVGQTGVAIGSHLHFEVRRGNVEDQASTKNPELWLTPNVDDAGVPMGALELSIRDQAGLIKQEKFNLEHHPGRNQPAERVYYEVSYAAKMLNGEENAGIGDLPAGWYRITLLYNGNRYERWVEVQSGKLTQAVVIVK